MPIIYTSVAAVGRSVTTPEYEKKGLDRQIAVRLGELMAVGLPHARQLAYSGYVFNLNAFMYATAIQRRVLCSKQFFSAQVPISSLLTVPLPPLFLAPKKAVKTDEEKTQFAISVGNAELSKFGARDVYVLHNPTLDQITKLPFKEIDTNCPSPPNGTSIIGFRSMLTTLKIITLFLSTHTYPAFTSADQTTTNYEYDISVLNEIAVEASNDFRYSADIKERYAAIGVGSMTLEEDTLLEDGTVVPEVLEWHHKLQDAVTVAKPAPFRPTINVGTPAELPFLPGFLFEYFQGCFIPDTTYVSTMMLECFINSLGDSKEKAIAGYESWQTGYEKWYKTDAGRIIGHIFLGIRLALQSQSRLFILKASGKYLGFALLGFKFSLGIGGKVVEADNADVMRVLASSLDVHSSALKDICSLLSETKMKGGRFVIVKPESIKSARQLLREINRREELQDEAWENLETMWNMVNFEERFWPLTHDKIAEAVRLIFSEDVIKEDLPLYLPAKLLYVTTRACQVLAVFGPMAPSFIDQRGTDIPIPVEGALDSAAVLDLTTGKRALEVILVTGKKIEAAIDDFNNMVKKRRIRQNFAERAAGYRTMKFNGDARDLLWSALKTMPSPKEPETRKRGREDDDLGEEGSAVKRGKQREVEVEFSMDF